MPDFICGVWPIIQRVGVMSNYPDIEGRLTSLEKQVMEIHERLDKVERMLRDLAKHVERAVTAQSIRDEWDGFA